MLSSIRDCSPISFARSICRGSVMFAGMTTCCPSTKGLMVSPAGTVDSVRDRSFMYASSSPASANSCRPMMFMYSSSVSAASRACSTVGATFAATASPATCVSPVSAGETCVVTPSTGSGFNVTSVCRGSAAGRGTTPTGFFSPSSSTVTTPSSVGGKTPLTGGCFTSSTVTC